MSRDTGYVALARKWRPRRFDEMVGQEHVLRALSNALSNDRVHHAFLFTGTRGVGKTTVARILAKCLNCERGVSETPCGECAACREIDEGRFVDLLEVDAASKTKIDDTRDLLDKVQYAPTLGRYKVYLIDEVHMLSNHSFNALLKTLEEPPPHVKFLLATTDPQKLPVTVLSRCLQFNLKRLPLPLIIERINTILQAENIAAEPAALRLVAQAADGSMRDGLSLLDQLIAFGGGQVTEADARAMLGTIDRGHVLRIAQLLADGDAAALLAYADELAQWVPDYAQLLDDLAALLARIAFRHAVADYDGDEWFSAEELAALAARISVEDTQLFYQAAILGRRDLALAPEPETGFAMTLLRMLVFRPAGTAPSTPQRAAAARAAQVPATNAVVAARSADWPQIVAALDLGGAARQLAAHCALQAREGDVLHLQLDPQHAHVRTRALEDKLAQALGRHFAAPIRLQIELAVTAPDTPARAEQQQEAAALDAARVAIETDPTVRALREKFGASVRADSVRSNNPGSK